MVPVVPGFRCSGVRVPGSWFWFSVPGSGSRFWFLGSWFLQVPTFAESARSLYLSPRRTCVLACGVVQIARDLAGTVAALLFGMASVKRFEDLICWQLSEELKELVFELTCREPVNRDRRFCEQIRESARSAPANIAEGFGWYEAQTERTSRLDRESLSGGNEEPRLRRLQAKPLRRVRAGRVARAQSKGAERDPALPALPEILQTGPRRSPLWTAARDRKQAERSEQPERKRSEPERPEPERPERGTPGTTGTYSSSNAAGSSISSFTRTRKRTASEPSTIR